MKGGKPLEIGLAKGGYFKFFSTSHMGRKIPVQVRVKEVASLSRVGLVSN
jgi:hypothetical protein